MRIDINCDLGEGGSNDYQLMQLVSSANVACGVHAGSPTIMRQCVQWARQLGTGLGAHPGLADAAGFGRREQQISPSDVQRLVTDQLAALSAIAGSEGHCLSHVKPHGALYNQAARDPVIAQAVAQAVRDFDRGLVLFGLAGSRLVAAAQAAGLRVAREAFVDRAYLRSGELAPRTQAGAVLHDVESAVRRAVAIVTTGRLVAIDGTKLDVQADSLCVHGDSPGALSLLERLREALAAEGIQVARVFPS